MHRVLNARRSDVLVGEPLDVLLEIDESVAVGVERFDGLLDVILTHALVDAHVGHALPELVHRQEAVCVANCTVRGYGVTYYVL